MSTPTQRIPPGPTERFDTAEDLLQWLVAHRDQHGGIYHASVYGSSVYVLSAPEHAEHVLLRNWRNYARKGLIVARIAMLLRNGLIASNGELWASQRRMVQRAFTRPFIAGLMPVIHDANAKLLAEWRSAALRGALVNVTRDVSNMVLEITLRALFGDDYQAAAREFNALFGASTRDLEFARTFRELGDLIRGIVARRRRAEDPGSDMLGILMQARDREHGRPMPDAQLVKEAMTIIVGGHETTSTALNWTWYLLARHPKVEAKLYRELASPSAGAPPAFDEFGRFSYTRQVIEETLRTYPPVWLMTRHAIGDDQLGEYFVPAGTEIFISPYLLQRDPLFWRAPGEFDPDRFAPEAAADDPGLRHCPFGAGPRNCIGERLARTEMQAHLMDIVPALRLRYDEPGEAEVVAGIHLLSRRDFYMTAETRSVVADLRAATASVGLTAPPSSVSDGAAPAASSAE